MKQFGLAAGAAALGFVAIAIASSLGDEGRMPEFGGAVGWLNSAPLSSKALRGKVVLVNFWTYSCINSLRELPYMKAWAAKYRRAGFVVVGVHAPEFGFERDQRNVANAVSALRIEYPILIDSNHSIWSAFRNEYWPADYIVDAKGQIRYHHFGEGEYERTEHVIQELLNENAAIGVAESTVRIDAGGAEAPPSVDVRSPETYVGYARMENFSSPESLRKDSQRTYSAAKALALNQWAFGGPWKVSPESAKLESAPGKIVFRFHARDLHIVLGPAKSATPVRFKVRLNGTAPGDHHGSDLGADGVGEVREPRMYQLIRQKGLISDAVFEIEFLDPGVDAYSFTFG